MVIDYVSKGTIINAHNSLSERLSTTNTKCLTSVSYYYLSVTALENICRAYKTLRTEVIEAKEQSYFNKMSYLAPLDYQETQFDFRDKYKKFSRGIDVLSDEELERVPRLRLMLKNAVMHKILELRFKSKSNNL